MTELEKKVLSYVDEKEVVEFLQSTIRCNSCYPPGDTREVAAVCAKKLQDEGIETQILTPSQNVKGATDTIDNSKIPSVLGWLRGNGPQMLWNAHIDTVPIGDLENWRHDPFSGMIEDGEWIYGRGAGDDKGPSAAQVMAMVALKRSGVKLKGTLVVNPVADEEGHGWRGTGWLAKERYYKPDIVVIGEQTNNEVALAERAYTFFRVIIHGESAHGGMPWNGNNAIVKAARFINLIDTELRPKLEQRTHQYLPHSSINVAKIHGGVKENVVPDYVEITLDRRVVPGETIDGAIAELQELLDRLAAEEPFEYEFCHDYRSGYPMYTEPDHPLIQTMLKIKEELTNQPAEPTGYRQGCDARYFSDWGIPIAIYGPSDPAVGHSPNERVSIKQLVEATKLYVLTALRVLGVEE